MIEIKVNDEIRDVTSDIFLGLNIWEVLWCIIGLVVGSSIGILVYFSTSIPISVISYIVILTAAPFAVMAFFKWHGMNVAEILSLFLNHLRSRNIKHYEENNIEYITYISHKKKRKKGKGKNELKNT